MTRRYRAVVRMLLCPMSCWITGSAMPSSSMWVAKATRRDLKETSGRWTPALSTARRNAAVRAPASHGLPLSVAVGEEVGALRATLEPVRSQFGQEDRWKERLPIPVPLAGSDVEHPAVAVDVADLEVDHFADPEPRCVPGQEGRPVLEEGSRPEDRLDLGAGEHGR